MSSIQPLPVGVGYGVVVGIGFFFAAVMCGISYIQVCNTSAGATVTVTDQVQNRYTRFSTKTSEEFNTASRSVKPGLIASGIVSAWTWAATLLQSSTVAYEYGVAGPFWVHKCPANLSKRGSFLLVCGRCHCTDSHVLDIGLQSQAERPEMPYLLGNYLHSLWRPNTLGFHLLRAPNKRLGQQPASLRRICSCHVSDWHERLCCHLSYTTWGLCLRSIGWAASYVPL